MIINTGQRTDIPAFYADWFANRLREGFVLVRNPYNPRSVTRYPKWPWSSYRRSRPVSREHLVNIDGKSAAMSPIRKFSLSENAFLW